MGSLRAIGRATWPIGPRLDHSVSRAHSHQMRRGVVRCLLACLRRTDALLGRRGHIFSPPCARAALGCVGLTQQRHSPQPTCCGALSPADALAGRLLIGRLSRTGRDALQTEGSKFLARVVRGVSWQCCLPFARALDLELDEPSVRFWRARARSHVCTFVGF